MNKSEGYDQWVITLEAHELYHPTRRQVEQLRLICETDHAIPHAAAYADELFALACQDLGMDGGMGSVAWVHANYRRLVEFVHRVQKSAAQETPTADGESGGGGG